MDEAASKLERARSTLRDPAYRKLLVLSVPVMGVLVAICVILFAEITGEPGFAILFSGSKALTPVVEEASTLGAATLAWLLLFKALAWMLSMGSFRGGPVFPAISVGTAAGILASELLPAVSLSAASRSRSPRPSSPCFAFRSRRP